MIEKLLDRVISEQGVLVACLVYALLKVWRRMNELIDRQLATIQRFEQRKKQIDPTDD